MPHGLPIWVIIVATRGGQGGFRENGPCKKEWRRGIDVHEHSQRAIWAAFLANLCVAVAKFVGFLSTGAASLLAEAFHSVTDTGNQLLLLLGAARARRPLTPSHPFGYAVALVL